MAILIDNGVQHIGSTDGLDGKTLAQVISWGYGWYLLQRHVMADQREDYAAIMAEIELQKEAGK